MNKVPEEKLQELVKAAQGGSLDRLGALAKPLIADMVREIMDGRSQIKNETELSTEPAAEPAEVEKSKRDSSRENSSISKWLPGGKKPKKEFGVVAEDDEDEGDDEQ